MVYSLILRLASRYATPIMFPITVIVGFIGYKIENLVSDKYTPSFKSIMEERTERQLNEGNEFQSIKEHKFVPPTILDRNLPPSLKEPDPRIKKYSNGS